MVTQSMQSIDEQLNSLVVELNRSFLQYLYECSPYAASGTEDAARVMQLASIQQQDVGVLCDVLLERQWPIDFGTYPTAYTASQYNSLEAMAGTLAESQQIVMSRLQEVTAACSEDAFVTEVLKQLLQNEQAILDDLSAISKK